MIAHDSLLHTHEHDDRPPSAELHEHPHPWLPGEHWHQHAHRHVCDLPALVVPEVTAWTENEDGPECRCGNQTVVKLMPGGRAILLCLFHTADSGSYTELPAERPEGWPGIDP